MQFVFIDEIECSQKNPKFFGLGAVVFSYYHYHKYKEAYKNAFEKLNWNSEIEFKGKYLFSKVGDKNISIDERISFVQTIVKETNAKSNARIKFYFSSNLESNSEKNYFELLKKLIVAIKPAGTGFKKLIGYYIDRNDKINKEKITELINNNCKGMVFERPFFVESGNQLPGIITVDILNYLQSWIVLNPDTEGQLKLFPEINENDKRKLVKIKEILSEIKNVKSV